MTIPVHVHSSQGPEAVTGQFIESLQTKRLRPKFHYVSLRQAQRWLELHQAYSPSRTNPDCQSMYEKIFTDTAKVLAGKAVQVIGLGCGGGGKDLQLLQALQTAGCALRYVPCDVSPALVLTAHKAALAVLPTHAIRPLIADLLEAPDLAEFWDQGADEGEVRVFSFLGMIPNFEPPAILGILKSWLRPQDKLILGANLLPGEDEEAALEDILPQYDNSLTRRWLQTVLDDLDIPWDNYSMSFSVKESPDDPKLKRIVADAFFSRAVDIRYEGAVYTFQAEDSFELFFSNRFFPAQLEQCLLSNGLKIEKRQLLHSGEEGVWLLSADS